MSINVAAIPSPFIHATIKRRKNTWYTIASGNWSDPNIWMSNSRRRYSSPQTGDDVSIGLGHTVTVNTAAISIYNLTVAGSLLFDTTARAITINGNIQATGAVNLSGAAHNLIINGVNNFVVNFTSGTSSTVTYSRVGDQPVMDLSYINLTTQNIGAKILPATAFTINGTTTVSTGSVLSKFDTNQVTFIGALNVTSSGIDFSGNPTIENRGGYTLNSLTSFTSGTSTWSFTTATQTATITTSTLQFNGNVSVVGAITVNEAGTGIMSLNQPIDCTSASGSVVAKGTIYFNSTSSLPSFTTGTFDRTSFANTVGYTMGASITLPYTSYWSLLVSNTGTKAAAGNTTLSGNYTGSNTLGTGGTFELGTSNLTVNGTTALSNGLSKTGAGSVLFVGLVSNGGSSASRGSIDFSGNPTVDLRGGLSALGGFGFSTFNTGTSQWKFSTNSQAISGGNVTFAFDAPILISGAITLTLTPVGAAVAIQANNTINGDNAASKLMVGSGTSFDATLALNTAIAPMLTGVMDITTSSKSVISYMLDGDFTIPMTSYNGLAIEGSGTKTLSGNTVLGYTLRVGSPTITSNSIFECASFNLSVSGITTLSSNSTFSKNAAGSILWADTLLVGGVGAPSINLPGNPSVELRNGINLNNRSFTTFSGNGTWTFSTNNQTIQNIISSALTLSCPVVISGAITLTVASTANITCANTLNGNNAASTFDNRGTVQYQATQQPMLTGVLQTNLAANTFIYNGNISQNITGGTYRTMQIGGTATPNNKTLQGNIVVATAYSVTGNAVLVLNSFTKT